MTNFTYTDYKAFLKERIGKGHQKHFASFLNCQPAFLSQVLRSKPHLSLEQGIAATDYFQMNSAEAEYFMLALQWGRSGTQRLKNFFKSRMEAVRDANTRVDSKIGKFEKLDDLSKATFYSSWKFALIHVLLSLPAGNQMELIKNKTGLSEKEIHKVLDFLKHAGLIEKQSGKWQPTKKRIHLSPEDVLVGTHHKNFRSLTIHELEDPQRDSLHYSSAMALSSKDAEIVKSLILELLAKCEAILKPSPEETVRIFSLDFFEPGTKIL